MHFFFGLQADLKLCTPGLRWALESSVNLKCNFVSLLLCFSGPKQDQAGDTKLLAEVHSGGAGALLQRHASRLLPF